MQKTSAEKKNTKYVDQQKTSNTIRTETIRKETLRKETLRKETLRKETQKPAEKQAIRQKLK